MNDGLCEMGTKINRARAVTNDRSAKTRLRANIGFCATPSLASANATVTACWYGVSQTAVIASGMRPSLEPGGRKPGKDTRPHPGT